MVPIGNWQLAKVEIHAVESVVFPSPFNVVGKSLGLLTVG